MEALDKQVDHIRGMLVSFVREYGKGKLGAADIMAVNLYLSLEAYLAMRKQAGIDIPATFARVEKEGSHAG